MYIINDNLLSTGHSQIILGVLLGLTTFAVLILSLAMIVILREKGKRIQEYYYDFNTIKVKQSLTTLYLIFKKLFMKTKLPQERIRHYMK